MAEGAPTNLVEELVTRATAYSLVVEDGTPQQKYQTLWRLYDLLNEGDPVDIMLAMAYKLNDLEPALTGDDKAELRLLGLTFPEDWENMKDYR